VVYYEAIPLERQTNISKTPVRVTVNSVEIRSRYVPTMNVGL
jgi:hypothetical protein